MSLVSDIMTVLGAAGVGSTTSTGTWRIVAWDFLPGAGTTMARQIAVTPTGGFDQEWCEELTYPTFQIRVRALLGSELEAHTRAVVDAVNLYGRSTAPGRLYLDMLQQGDMLFIGRDVNQLPMAAVNFMAMRSRTT